MSTAGIDISGTQAGSLPRWQMARRTEIREAARALLATRPYDEIQMRDVARAAGVALGTLYRYFSGKELLYSEVVASWVAEHMVATASPAPRTPSRRLRWKMGVVADAYERDPQYAVTHQRVLATADPSLRAALEDSDALSMQWLMADLDPLPPLRRADIGMLLVAVMNEIVAQVTVPPISADRAARLADTFVGLIAGELEAAAEGSVSA